MFEVLVASGELFWEVSEQKLDVLCRYWCQQIVPEVFAPHCCLFLD